MHINKAPKSVSEMSTMWLQSDYVIRLNHILFPIQMYANGAISSDIIFCENAFSDLFTNKFDICLLCLDELSMTYKK